MRASFNCKLIALFVVLTVLPWIVIAGSEAPGSDYGFEDLISDRVSERDSGLSGAGNDEFARGGGFIGNGGGGLRCSTPSGRGLFVLEYVENFGRQKWLPPDLHESPEQYLSRILETRLKPVLPILADKIEAALAGMKLREWVRRRELPLIQDTGPIHLSPKILEKLNCERVQLVRRQRLGENADGTVRFRIEYNLAALRELQAHPDPKVRVLNQAMLLLHEAVYALGIELEHSSSHNSRRIVATLFDPETYKYDETWGPMIRRTDVLERLLASGFARYPQLFLPRRPHAGSSNLAAILARVFVSMREKQLAFARKSGWKSEEIASMGAGLFQDPLRLTAHMAKVTTELEALLAADFYIHGETHDYPAPPSAEEIVVRPTKENLYNYCQRVALTHHFSKFSPGDLFAPLHQGWSDIIPGMNDPEKVRKTEFMLLEKAVRGCSALGETGPFWRPGLSPIPFSESRR